MKNQHLPYSRNIFYLFGIILLTGCSGGGSSGASDTPAITAAVPALTFTAIKTFHFSWADTTGATHYKLLENPSGNSGFSQVGSDIPQGTQNIDQIVPLYEIGRASRRERV